MIQWLRIGIVGLSVVLLSACGSSSATNSLNIDNLEDGYEVVIENISNVQMKYRFCADKYTLADMHNIMVVPGTYTIRNNRYIDFDVGDNGTVETYMDVQSDTIEVGETYDLLRASTNIKLDEQEIVSITGASCP